MEPRVMLAADVVISEFLAANQHTLADRDGDYEDWIEIHNRGDSFADLSGWHLTDEEGRLDLWTFPDGVGLEPGQFKIVFASDKPALPDNAELRANFRLEKSGEYLALVRPDRITIEFEYPFPFPAQTDDVSYGLARPDAPEDEHAFFSTPTPGAANPATVPTSNLTPVFSQESQTFAGSITVSLVTSSPAPGTAIRYTTNGSTPTASSPLYIFPMTLSTTTLLRARVFEIGKNPGPVVTRTYVAMAPNVVNFESNLPVVVLDTLGQGLGSTNLSSVAAYVIDTNPLDGRARMADLPQYSGRSGLRYRGQSSQGFPKRPYAFETWDETGDDMSVPLLGMPSESDWVLYNPYSEKSLLQNHLAYTWSNAMGQYASRTRFVEVFVNSSGGTLDYGDYVGIYILEEKIKRDAERVDITPLGPNDNTGIDVTGGYIFKIDKLDGGEQYFYTNGGQPFLHVEPEVFELTSQQKNYLYGYLNSFEAALNGPNFRDPVIGYRAYIDVESWIDHHIMVEMAKNIDGFRISTYFYKDRGGKIKMGPIWDYNLSMGNADYHEGQYPTGWYNETGLSGTAYPYWRRLFQDPDFQQQYTDRWQELRRTVFRTDRLMADIDAATQLLADGTANYPVGQFPSQTPNNALVRNFQRWNVLGVYLWPNGAVHQAWIDELNRVKTFMTTRTAWIDSQYVAAPTASHAGGKVSGTVPLALSASGGGTQIWYTTNGSDPRLSGGTVSPTATRYTGQISINQTTRVRARALSGGRWSGVTDLSFLYDDGLRISEVMYHPHDPPAGSTRPDDAFEYIELHNAGAQPINLGGYRFDNGIDYTFPAGSSIGSGEYRILVSDITAFGERYPGVAIDGMYAGRLDNNGERVRLVNAAGVVIFEFRYGDGGAWPGRADGGASSLEPINAGGDLNDPKNWRSSIDYAGSPRAAGSTAGANVVVINELLTRTTAPVVDAIELYNPTDTRIDVSGWYLSDAQSNYAKFRIPEDTFIESHSYLVFDEGDFNPTPESPQPHHFALDGLNGDDVWLVRADLDGQLRAFVDSVHFAGGAAAEGVSLGRVPDGSGRLRPLRAPSLGAPNGGAAIGEVVISEVMYNHQGKKEVAEFVELYNRTPNPIELAGWRFDGGIDFVFPAGTVLPALGRLVVVPFNPLDPREAPRLQLFRSTYGLDGNTPLVGGFAGRLDNAGDGLRLSRPDATGYAAVDEVGYEPTAPWPISADGGGSSLTRVSQSADGRDVTAWSAVAPTPGVHALSSLNIVGSAADEVFEIRLAEGGTHAEVFFGPAGSPPSRLQVFELASVQSLSFDLGGGDDRLVIDLASATLASPLNVSIVGAGSGAADADFLAVAGPVQLPISAALELTDLNVTHGARVTLEPGTSINATRLVVSDGGVLDIGTGQVLVREGSLRAINDAIASARNGGTTRWGGPGITSGAISGNDLSTVAVREDADGILVKWALDGDANLDGRVNADDYFRIDQAFLAQPAAPTYDQGDFNYDGKLNADDYFLIDQAFLGQAAQGGALAAAASTSRSAARGEDEGLFTRSSRRKTRSARQVRK